MPTLLTLDIPVRLTGGFPTAELDVRLSPQANIADQAEIAVELDASLASAALPRASREQVLAPWRITVGGRSLPWHRMLPGAFVEESLEGVTTFGFSAPRFGTGADRFMEPLGSPAAWLGVPGGKGAVEISAEFLAVSGRKSVPLVRDGVLDNSSADASTRSWNGGGAHGRVDRVPITYQAPPGHGQTSGTVVRRILELAGVPASKIAISGGRRLYKELTLVDAQPIASCNAILEPELRRVYHDERTDTWRTLDYSGVEGKRVEWVIREADVLAVLGSLGDAAAADAPTAITLTGSAQVTREECGRRLEYQVIDSFAVQEVRGARFTQGAGGALTPVAWKGSAAILRRVSRVVSVREIDCETVLAEEVVTWGWHSPEVARYRLATDGSTGAYSTAGFLYDAGATADDGTPMYLWQTERWVPVSWRRVDRSYDAAGYLVEGVEREGGWGVFPLPVKKRTATSASWETTAYETEWTLASGTAVDTFGFVDRRAEWWRGPQFVYDETNVFLGIAANVGQGSPTLQRVYSGVVLAPLHDRGVGSPDAEELLAETTTRYTVEGGFITAEDGESRRLFPVPSLGKYLFHDEGESTQEAPAWQVEGSTQTRYGAAGEDKHDRFSLRRDHTGRIVESEESFGEPGYLPVADQRQDIVPPASTYDDPAEAEFALAASRHESRPIKVRVSAPALEAVLVPWEQKGRTVEYAETEDDLAAVGAYLIREASAIGVQVPLLFNPLVRPGHRIILDLPTLGMHHDMLAERVRHLQEDRVTWTQVGGRRDVV